MKFSEKKLELFVIVSSDFTRDVPNIDDYQNIVDFITVFLCNSEKLEKLKVNLK